MTTWQLSPIYKKNAVERQFFRNDAGQVIVITEGFRGATFTIESDTMPLTQEQLDNTDEGFLLNFDWELQEMWDGSWLEIEVGELDQGDVTEEELEQFQEAWGEDSYEGVEALGWFQDDVEYVFYGPLELKNTETGEEFRGRTEAVK